MSVLCYVRIPGEEAAMDKRKKHKKNYEGRSDESEVISPICHAEGEQNISWR